MQAVRKCPGHRKGDKQVGWTCLCVPLFYNRKIGLKFIATKIMEPPNYHK